MNRECELCGKTIDPTQLSKMCENCYTKAHGLRDGVPTFKLFHEKKKEFSQIMTKASTLMAMLEASSLRHYEALRQIEYICINEPNAVEAATRCADIAREAWQGKTMTGEDQPAADLKGSGR